MNIHNIIIHYHIRSKKRKPLSRFMTMMKVTKKHGTFLIASIFNYSVGAEEGRELGTDEGSDDGRELELGSEEGVSDGVSEGTSMMKK